MPAFLRLNGINWQRIEQQVAEAAHRKNGELLRYHWQKYHGKRDGRQIFRWPLRYGRWVVKLTLPVPTPADRAISVMTESRKVMLEAYTNSDNQGRNAAPKEREYLAWRLKSISITLNSQAHDLATVLNNTPTKATGVNHGREPAIVGHALASADYFWRCWHEFHEAERPSPATTPASPGGAAAFWEALRRMPMEVEWVNNSPRYTVPVDLLGCDDFNEDLRPLREAVEAALPKLKTKHLRLLRGELGELLSIDGQSFKRVGELHKEQNYDLQNLPNDYPILRFDLASPGRGLATPWQWVNPSIWTGFVVLLQNKQEVARAIYDKVSIILDKPAYSLPKPATKPVPAADTVPPLAGPSHFGERLPIDGFLSIPRTTLDQLLLDAAMIEPSPSPGRYTAKEKVKPWQWANVRAALQERLLLAELNDEDAAQLFTETYGAKVGRGTMQQRPQTPATREQNKRRIHAYKEFYGRLPVPKRL